jgi:serine/threonine kinase 16
MQAGNLQDAINANVINGTHFPEQEMVRLFKGTCQAVRAMHDYRSPIKTPSSSSGNQSQAKRRQQEESRRHQEDEDDEMFPQPEGDGEDGYSYGPAVNVPLMTKHRVEDEGDVVFDGDEELMNIQQNGNAETGQTELVPYAHRDLKPGYANLYTWCFT